MIILGIDPGTSRIGYGLINKNSKLTMLAYGTLEISNRDLLALSLKFEKLLKKFKPELMAIEKLYFAKNTKTALNVAQAQGAIILKTLEHKIKIVEYSPNEIKQTVTGYGKADKKAVALMVKNFLHLKDLKGYDDASDALAIAITAAHHLTPIDKKIDGMK